MAHKERSANLDATYILLKAMGLTQVIYIDLVFKGNLPTSFP